VVSLTWSMVWSGPADIPTSKALADPADRRHRLRSRWRPDSERPDPASDAQPAPSSITTVRSAHTGTGTWS